MSPDPAGLFPEETALAKMDTFDGEPPFVRFGFGYELVSVVLGIDGEVNFVGCFLTLSVILFYFIGLALPSPGFLLGDPLFDLFSIAFFLLFLKVLCNLLSS